MGVSSPSCFIDYIIKNKKIWKIQLGDYIQLYTTTKK